MGTSMSVIEILVAIFSTLDVEKIRNKQPDRSRVIISKGHCAAGTYSTMAHFGLIPDGMLDTYHQDGSVLAGHVSHGVEFVEHSTGALGHGMSVACGCALGLRSRGFHNSHVYALVGDGEIQEGSVWEAVMLANHEKLSNLITLVDNNRISSITSTHEVIDMRPLRSRFEGFGFRVYEVDGHDADKIIGTLQEIQAGSDVSVIICNTVKGYGIPFAENDPIWHYRPLDEESYKEALSSLERN